MIEKNKITVLALSLSVLTLAGVSTLLSLNKSNVLGDNIVRPIERSVPCNVVKSLVDSCTIAPDKNVSNALCYKLTSAYKLYCEGRPVTIIPPSPTTTPPPFCKTGNCPTVTPTAVPTTIVTIVPTATPTPCQVSVKDIQMRYPCDTPDPVDPAVRTFKTAEYTCTDNYKAYIGLGCASYRVAEKIAKIRCAARPAKCPTITPTAVPTTIITIVPTATPTTVCKTGIKTYRVYGSCLSSGAANNYGTLTVTCQDGYQTTVTGCKTAELWKADASKICYGRSSCEPIKITPAPISCGWCGTDCIDLSKNRRTCLDVAPPSNFRCYNIGGVCTKVNVNPEIPTTPVTN